eukprot:scaffold17980_cov40-Cyclotella_meneghiniana.AAC.4
MPSFFDEKGDPALSPYTVLSLPPTATETEIKKAYRAAMLQLHPDKLSPNLSEEEIAIVTEKFHNVKDAYEFLTGAQYLTARRLYMAKLASRRAEYERREAFLRRANIGVSDSRMARTRMTEPPSSQLPARLNNASRKMNYSYVVDPKSKNYQSVRSRGYTSDNGPTARRTPRSKAPRSDSRPRSHSRKGQNNEWNSSTRTRATSEPRRQKQGSESYADDRMKYHGFNKRRPYDKPRNTERPSRLRDESGKRQKKRSRAKSAPARCRAAEPKIINSNKGRSSIPEEFYCPLSKRVMKDPVIDPEGNTYEREAIERWLRVQASSPITNAYLSLEMLRPGRELKSKIYQTASLDPNHNLVYHPDPEHVPILPRAGFMVYCSFDARSVDLVMLSHKINAWNEWLSNIKWNSRVSHVMAGNKMVFSLKGSEKDMIKFEPRLGSSARIECHSLPGSLKTTEPVLMAELSFGIVAVENENTETNGDVMVLTREDATMQRWEFGFLVCCRSQ